MLSTQASDIASAFPDTVPVGNEYRKIDREEALANREKRLMKRALGKIGGIKKYRSLPSGVTYSGEKS